MSLRKRPALTPKLLAANASNARKSTGPRTRRGKAFSKLNGWKGGRPSKSTYPFPMGENWQPDMSDPDFVRWMLTQMREEYPESFAIWMQCSPEHRHLLTGMEDGGDRPGAPKVPK
jgi:hypothetical protein